VHTVLCLLTPGACAGTSIATASVGGIFSAIAGWIVDSLQWLLSSLGGILTSASEPSTVVNGATHEFDVLLSVSPILMVVALLIATLQFLRHADSAALWRLYLGVAPACVAAIFLARPLATLILSAVNGLSDLAAGSVGSQTGQLSTALMGTASSTPGFGLLLIALGATLGTVLLWCELIVRGVLLTVLLALVPVIVPLGILPAVRRVCWRLLETFVAVAASKFIIVVILQIGLADTLGSLATQVVTGIVTLLLATLSPFTLLRIVPLLEASALHSVAGLRSRATNTALTATNSPTGTAIRSVLPDESFPRLSEPPEDFGIPMWPSDPDVDPGEPWKQYGPPPPPPIGPARKRKGHHHLFKDRLGPSISWHWDD
jgi:hypothetical protein